MKSIILSASLLAILSQIISGSEGVCSFRENNIELVEYSCEGGTAADLAVVPDNVEKLRISNMPLDHITQSTFSRFSQTLLVLACSHCSISAIDDNAFRGFSNLQQLSLDNNRLREFKSTSLDSAGLESLTYLDLNYNQIEKIDGDVFRLCPNIVDLRLSGNQLQCLDLESLNKLVELRRIFITDNPRFGCPHALKKYLATRNVELEHDPHWDSMPADRVSTVDPIRTYRPTETTPRYPSTHTTWTQTTYPVSTNTLPGSTYPRPDPYYLSSRYPTPPRPPTPPEMVYTGGMTDSSRPYSHYPSSTSAPYYPSSYSPPPQQQQQYPGTRGWNSTSVAANTTQQGPVTTVKATTTTTTSVTTTTTECPSGSPATLLGRNAYYLVFLTTALSALYAAVMHHPCSNAQTL